MRNTLIVIAAAAISLGTIFAAEKKIGPQDLPPAVQKAVPNEIKGAEIKGYNQETEKGKTFYEVETRLNGKSRDLLFDASGALVEVEEEIAFDSIPSAARAAIEKRAANGKVNKVESVTKGQSVSYEAEITSKSGKRSEVAVKADGSSVK
jgi:uncharacterized membrane protein YkoI